MIDALGWRFSMAPKERSSSLAMTQEDHDAGGSVPLEAPRPQHAMVASGAYPGTSSCHRR